MSTLIQISNVTWLGGCLRRAIVVHNKSHYVYIGIVLCCVVAPDIARGIRSQLAGSVRYKKGSFPCRFLNEFNTFSLPCGEPCLILTCIMPSLLVLKAAFALTRSVRRSIQTHGTITWDHLSPEPALGTNIYFHHAVGLESATNLQAYLQRKSWSFSRPSRLLRSCQCSN